MSEATDKTEIAGLKITTVRLPPRRAFKLGAQLLKYALPALAGVAGDTELDAAAFTRIGLSALRDLDVDQLDEIMCKAFAGTTVIRPEPKAKQGVSKHELGDPDEIDRAFDGKLSAMLEALKWVLKFNFADFFADASGKLAAASQDASEKDS